MINPFKNAIQIRKKTLKLGFENHIKEIFTAETKNWKIDISDDLDAISFYTYTPNFWEGVRNILQTIKEHSSGQKKVKISLIKKNVEIENEFFRLYVILIEDIGSLINAEPNKEELLKGNLKRVHKSFAGFCNWSVTARFNYNNQIIAHKLNILKDSNVIECENLTTTIESVIHEITFYA